MKGIYLYPITSRNQSGFHNPYVDHLSKVLADSFKVVNADSPSGKGILDLPSFLKKVDFLYLNWIENLPARKMGRMQSLLFLVLMMYCKLSGRKVIWTMHNKASHSSKQHLSKSLLFRFMVRNSDLIITHAREGLEAIPAGKPSLFFHHPCIDQQMKEGLEKQHDILIWGSIAYYKGVHKLLDFMEQEGILGDYRILIAGKVVDEALGELLARHLKKYPNLQLDDRFIPDQELDKLIRQSSLVLFPYQSASVLSSGALMDSLPYPVQILGPHAGAFKDLSEEKLLRTFGSYADLAEQLSLLKEKGFSEPGFVKRRVSFLQRNGWKDFGAELKGCIKDLH